MNPLQFKSARPNQFRTLFASLGLVSLAVAPSCKKYSCYTYGIRGLEISASGTIADTNAQVTRFSPDGTFSNLLEAYSVSVNGPASLLLVNFPISGKEVWKYDWQVMLRPSGKLYKLSQFKAESEESITHCVNPVHLILNDSAVVCHGVLTGVSDTASMYLYTNY